MANTKVTTGVIKDDAVGADQLASNSVVTASIVDNAVLTAKIQDQNVTTAKIANASVTVSKMGPNSVDSDQYVDGSIDTAHIADSQITSAKLETNIAVDGTLTLGSHLIMGDNDILKMGAGADLQIYSDGTHSRIYESGSGLLIIRAGNFNINNADGSQSYITMSDGGAATLYYAGSAKLATATGGVTVTGTISSGAITTSGNLTASQSVLSIINNDIRFKTSGDATMLRAVANGAVEIMYSNSTKLATTSTGIDVTGVITTDGLTTSADINFGDNDKAIFGAGSDLQIYHDGSNSYVKDDGTGDLYIQGEANVRITDGDGNKMFLGQNDGEVQLYYNGSEKLNTTSTGIDVTGTAKTTNLLIDDGVVEFDKPNVKGFRFLQNDTGNDLSIQQGDTNNANYVTKFNINTSGNATFAGTINTTGLTAQTGGTAGIADVVSFNASGNGGSGRGTGILIKAAGSSSAVSVARIVGLQETAASTANNASLAFQVAASNGTLTERMRIDASGKVNIGGTTMSGLLNIQTASSSVAPQIEFRNTAAGAQIGMPANTNALSFHTADSERLRIDASGSVLINETNSSPSNIGTHYLVVQRSTSLNGGAAFGMNTGGDVASRQQVTFFNANGTVGSIFTNGSATAYNTSSDYRLKENVNYTFNALDRVAQLKPARFNFIADADTTVDGFIAHEVQDIIPEAVSGEKDGEQMQGMDYGRITPLLVKAIQEQQTLIESLTARIEELEE